MGIDRGAWATDSPDGFCLTGSVVLGVRAGDEGGQVGFDVGEGLSVAATGYQCGLVGVASCWGGWCSADQGGWLEITVG